MNLNKDYIAVVDVKSATVVVPSKMNFYITDIKTANIFAQLVINESDSELIKKYAPVENAQDFEITLRVIKPNNQFMEIKFTLLNQLEAFFMVDLTDEFKDYIGTYKCELFVDSQVNGELERITTASFRYKVSGSIANSLDEVIEGDPDYPLVEEILSKLEGVATEEYVSEAIDNIEIPEVDLTGYATEEYVDESIGKVVTIIGNNTSTAISWDDIPSGSGYYKLTGILNDSISLNNEIVYITRITTGLFMQATLHSVGKPIANTSDTIMFTDWDNAAGKYNTATNSKHATEQYVDDAVANISGGGSIDTSNLITINDIVIFGDGENELLLRPSMFEDGFDKICMLKPNVKLGFVDEFGNFIGTRYNTDVLYNINTWVDEDIMYLAKMDLAYGSYVEYMANEDDYFVPIEESRDSFVWQSSMENYAEKSYVDSLIGDIEAALSAILGGEDTGGSDWPTGGGAGGWPTGGGA